MVNFEFLSASTFDQLEEPGRVALPERENAHQRSNKGALPPISCSTNFISVFEKFYIPSFAGPKPDYFCRKERISWD
jgi:hypothetical protein